MRTRFLEKEILESGVTQRWLTASIALRVFVDNIFTGVGFTGFRYIALDYGAVEMMSKELGSFAPNFIATAGNQYLQVATDGGIIALVIFIWMLVVFGLNLRRAELCTFGEQRASFAAGYLWLLSLAIGNQSAAWMLPGSLISYFLWILLGLSIGDWLRVSQNKRAMQQGLKVAGEAKAKPEDNACCSLSSTICLSKRKRLFLKRDL
jgi:O-antigen ligase